MPPPTDRHRGEGVNLPIPFPVISNAEPWIGSNMDGFSRVGSRLLVGAMPIDPARAAARSDRISACCTVGVLSIFRYSSL